MSLGGRCGLRVWRGSAAVGCVPPYRQLTRRQASSATVRRTAFTATAALAGMGVAAVSLLVLAADGSMGDTVEADDGSPSADGLSHAPAPSAVGSSQSAGYAAQLNTVAQQPHEARQQSSDHPAAVTAAAAGANQPSSVPSPSGKPHLVILGSGWGAVSLLKGLDRDAYEVTVISPRNYFLFTPLLPSATTGQVESRTLMEPIRRICHRVKAHYFEGKVSRATMQPNYAHTGRGRTEKRETERWTYTCKQTVRLSQQERPHSGYSLAPATGLLVLSVLARRTTSTAALVWCTAAATMGTSSQCRTTSSSQRSERRTTRSGWMEQTSTPTSSSPHSITQQHSRERTLRSARPLHSLSRPL